MSLKVFSPFFCVRTVSPELKSYALGVLFLLLRLIGKKHLKLLKTQRNNKQQHKINVVIMQMWKKRCKVTVRNFILFCHPEKSKLVNLF